MSEPSVDPWTPFLFGKLPAHGDFVARGLTADAQAAWDHWGQATLESARITLQDAFEEAHDTAPTMLFVCGPSPRADGWSCGSAAASVDSVGRRFIIVVGVQRLSPKEALFLGAGVAERGEAAIRAALVDGLTADETIEFMEGSLTLERHREAAANLDMDVAPFGLWWRANGDAIDKGVEPPPRLIAAPLIPSLVPEDAAT